MHSTVFPLRDIRAIDALSDNSHDTKTHTSYLKNKKEKSSLTGKEGQDSRYVEQFYQVWDEYFWMTPEKGQSIIPTTICWEQKESRVGFGDRPLDQKERKYMGYP